MTPKEFADAMRAIKDLYGCDNEMAHARADELLCKLLESLGYEEGVKVFDEMDKWYA